MALSDRQGDPQDYVQGHSGDWEVIVGMEVHAQVNSRAKLFSGASTEFGAPANENVSYVDAAMPGMLPVINRECVAQAIRTGLGLKARINRRSVFDRKNYFYPDLPQGYQISQFKQPIVGEGAVEVALQDGARFTVGIERLHLEQDAGKSVHDLHPSLTFIDLNRSGVGLMEIVTRPDIRSAAEARAFLTMLRAILRYLGTCDGDMEKGNLRADVNVSVRRPGGDFGTRCEIKNVNSIRFVGEAVDHEARRQIEILEAGGSIEQETRLFDPDRGETRPMRDKEEAHDYRYFPDPDLVPLEVSEEWLAELAANLPELPEAKRARFVAEYGLGDYDADILVAEKETADYFEAMVGDGAEPKASANWLVNEYFGRLNREGLELADGPVSAAANAAIVRLVGDGTISGKIAKQVFDIVWQEGGDPAAIVEERGLRQVTDTGAIAAMVDEIVAANPDKVAEARERPQMLGWFVGQVMKASQGKANPQAVSELLKQKLGIE